MKQTQSTSDQVLCERDAAEFNARIEAEGLSPRNIRRFRTGIYRYYKRNARNSLPWRNTGDPYQILVSEIMLQQTPVERVLNKYNPFLKRFPDFQSLASADVRHLYAAWSGLGYNRRVLALRNISRIVTGPPYNGALPPDVKELRRLPFVGQSTAGAVAAFAFHQPVAFIETNIRRVFIHFFFQGIEGIPDSDIIPLIQKTLDRKDPRNWYYALMDYGDALSDLKLNPNRKSARYRKQGPFAGSNRQMRGLILHLLSGHEKMTSKDLSGHLNTSRDKIREIIDQLCRDGFVRKNGRYIRMD